MTTPHRDCTSSDRFTSGLAKDVDSEYVVSHRSTGAVQTGCFILKPLTDRNAFFVLIDYAFALSSDDPKRGALMKWLKELESIWAKRALSGETSKIIPIQWGEVPNGG